MPVKELYKTICAEAKALPVFAQHWWMDAVCEDWSVAIARKGDKITGVWPYSIQSRIGIGIMRNARLTPYMGPVVLYPDDIKESNRDGQAHEVITALADQLPAAKVWHLSLHPGDKQAGLYRSIGLQPEVQQTFLIDLGQPEATLYSNLKESLRRNIRAAEQEFTISNEPACMDTLYRYQQHTLSAKGVKQAHTLPQMQQLMDACTAYDSAALWVARKGSEVAALVWNVWDKERSYYLMGAQQPGGESYRAISALLWHSIKQAQGRGNKVFDMEGSMDPGVERFFRGFGGTRELYMILRKTDSTMWKAIRYVKSRK